MSAIACRYHLSAGGLLLTFLIFLVLVSGCTHAATSDGPAPTQSQAALPAPIAVCVLDGDGGAIQFGTASPERAGTYDPRAPIDPKTLNWVVTGIGCVNYPTGLPRDASCLPDGGSAPLVKRQLCGQ